jgi:hypothetical protein
MRSERNTFPRRAAARLDSRPLPLGGQAAGGGKSVWYPEQGDSWQGSCRGRGIACQPLGE